MTEDKPRDRPALTITCFYSCSRCGLVKQAVEVPAREAEDVTAWVEHVLGWALKRDHALRSPGCPAQQAQDVMIPMTGADKVGGSAVQ